MVKAKATTKDGQPLYVFGLSFENLARLKEGKPIYFSLKDIGVDSAQYAASRHQKGDCNRRHYWAADGGVRMGVAKRKEKKMAKKLRKEDILQREAEKYIAQRLKAAKEKKVGTGFSLGTNGSIVAKPTKLIAST